MLKPQKLINLGSTCFMNSAIQVLTHSKYITQFLLQNKENGPLSTEGALLCQNKTGPENIKQLMGEYYEIFAGYEQQDSHEFLTLYLNQVQNEFEHAVKENKIPENSISLDQLLIHTMEITLTCTQCNHCQKRQESDQQLMLDLSFLKRKLPDIDEETPQNQFQSPRRRRYEDSTLDDCLAEHFRVEEFELECQKCRKTTQHYQDVKLTKIPRQLVIVLKKFDIFNNKIQNQITFYKHIDLQNFCKNIDKSSYSLNAVSLHAGDTGCGHYTAYAVVDGQEYLCDDSYITTANIDYNDQRAYILTYSLDE